MSPEGSSSQAVRLVRTRRGARLVQDGLVLSEIVNAPGPTNSLFDVLAAALAALASGPRVLVLGFAGGGVVAPLRAMGFGHPLSAVDLSLEGERLFRSLSGPWAGRVQVARAEAAAWMRKGRGRWDGILEDLSDATAHGVTKPSVSLGPLPRLVAKALRPRGVAVTNVLPVPGIRWADVLARLAAPHRHALVVHLDEYENRLLVGSRARLDARAASRALTRHLAAIGSNQARRLAVRTWRPS